MRSLSTAIAVEGTSDETYFRVLVERVLRDIAITHGAADFDVAQPVTVIWNRSSSAASHWCHQVLSADPRVVFFHYDGTANVQRERKKVWLTRKSEWDAASGALAAAPPPIIELVPVRETESWVLADLDQVNRLVRQDVAAMPVFEVEHLRRVERLSDPKRTFQEALDGNRSSRRPRHRAEDFFQLLAERISLDCLARVPSFRTWRASTVESLRDLGFLR